MRSGAQLDAPSQLHGGRPAGAQFQRRLRVRVRGPVPQTREAPIGPPIGRIAMGMIALIIVAVVAACLLMVWSLCRAAALGDEIAENLRKEAGHEGE